MAHLNQAHSRSLPTHPSNAARYCPSETALLQCTGGYQSRPSLEWGRATRNGSRRVETLPACGLRLNGCQRHDITSHIFLASAWPLELSPFGTKCLGLVVQFPAVNLAARMRDNSVPFGGECGGIAIRSTRGRDPPRRPVHSSPALGGGGDETGPPIGPTPSRGARSSVVSKTCHLWRACVLFTTMLEKAPNMYVRSPHHGPPKGRHRSATPHPS